MPCSSSEPRVVEGLLAAWFSAADVSPADGTSALDGPLLGALADSLPATSLTAITTALGPQLTSEDGLLRRRATALLAGLLEVLCPLPAPGAAGAGGGGSGGGGGYLHERAPAVCVLLDFFLERFSDFPSLLPALRATRALLRVIESRPAMRPRAAVEVARALFRELHVQAAEQGTRQAVYQLLMHLATSPVHSAAIVGAGAAGGAAGGAAAAAKGEEEEEEEEAPYALDFVAGCAAAMDGEKDPRCLLTGLALARHLLLPLPFGDATESLAQELFDVTACYFPITFTPPPNDPHGITSEMLSSALCAVFSAAPRLAPLVVPLLLEKLTSSLMDSKRAACAALAACAPIYGPSGLAPHLADIASSLRGEAANSKERQLSLVALEKGSGGAGAGASQPAPPAVSSWLAGEAEEVEGAAPLALPGGHSLLPPTPPSPTPTTGARPPPPTLADCALTTITAITRILSHAAAASPLPCQRWMDWFAFLVRSSASEFERAPDSAAGRASARILCAVASASHHALSAVLALAIPLCHEVLRDATAHARHAHTARVASLLAALLNCVDASIDHLPGQHPLHPHAEDLVRILEGILGGSREAGSEGAGVGAAAAAAAAAAPAPAPTPAPASTLTPLQEAQCLATAGLFDLCSRAPTCPLPTPQLRALILRLTAQCLSDDPASYARHAALLALASMASATRPPLAAVLQEAALPVLLEALEAACAGAAPPLQGMRALRALGRLAHTTSLPLWSDIAPALLHAATAGGAGGSAAQTPTLRCRHGSSAPHPLALALLQHLTHATHMRALHKEAAFLDVLVRAAPPSKGAGSAEAEAVGRPSPLSTLVLLAANEPQLTACPDLAPLLERTLRALACGASDAVQDALHAYISSLLLHLPHAPEGAARDALSAAALPAPSLLPSASALAHPLSLQIFTSMLSCSRRGAPLPHAGALATLLCSSVLEGSCSTPACSRACAQCVGTLLNRLEDAPAAQLAAQALGSIQEAWRGEGEQRLRALVLCAWALKGLAQRGHPQCAPFLDFMLNALEVGGVSPSAPSMGGGGSAQRAPLQALQRAMLGRLCCARQSAWGRLWQMRLPWLPFQRRQARGAWGRSSRGCLLPSCSAWGGRRRRPWRQRGGLRCWRRCMSPPPAPLPPPLSSWPSAPS